MTILVLTHDMDPTADLIVQELTDRRVPVFRCDAREFPERLALVARFDGAWKGWLQSRHREVALEAIQAVYYRRPSSFALAHGMSTTERRFAAAEARLGFGGVLGALPCRWVNHPSRMAEADYKPLQLQVAAQCGLRTPHTLITNVPEAMCCFGDDASRIIYKTLSGQPDFENGMAVSVYTSIVSPDDYGDPSIGRTAHLFQEWVPKRHEVRVTVVGERQFAVEIHAQHSPSGAVDWRADYASHEYRVVTVPEAERRGISAMMARLGLTFGALDFVVTPDGDWVFLEINPNGQWGWLQAATDLPIAAALADALLGELGEDDVP